MNESVDYISLFERNAAELRTYLRDAWPISEERLIARRNYEELLKNMARRARAVGCDPAMIEPEYFALFERFVRQNVDAEVWQRKSENLHHYERGRAEMQELLGRGPVPTSFQQPGSSSVYDDALLYAPASTDSVPQPAFRADVNPSRTQGPARMSAERLTEPASLEEAAVALPRDKPVKEEAVCAASRLRFSEALAEYLEHIRGGGKGDARSIVKLLVQFLIDVMDDPFLHEFDEEAVRRLDEMMPEIPNRKNIPRERCVSLSARYFYAVEHGWEGLERLTEMRIRNHYHDALSRFFTWAIDKGYYPFAKPTFKKTSPENLVSVQRDAFKPDEVKRIFSQPLFNGCKSPTRHWEPGQYLIQNHLYWGYILSFLTGMRPGEIGQVELNDIQPEDGIFYLHLRAFDPSKGRVARKDVKRFKTPSSQRVIPLHPLIIELGLLERIDELKKIGCPVLFPEWAPYPKPGAELRWGQPLTKSFQYLKRKAGLERFDTALYSARHWFADLLDSTDIKHVTRKRVMGHSNNDDMPSRYGSKHRLTTRDLKHLTKLQMPVLDEVAVMLLGAKQKADKGELNALKPWRSTAHWSSHYRTKLGR